MRLVHSVVASLALAGGTLAQNDGSGGVELDPVDVAQTAAEDYPIHGYLDLGMRARWTGDANDSDLFGFLTLDGGDPTRHDWTFHVSTRIWQDLGGGTSPDNPFFSVTDTYSGGTQLLVYRAYLQANASDDLEFLRIGRQEDIETPEPAYYDGVHARTRTDRDLWGGAYGGLANHLFESTDNDDRVFGAYAGSRPWDGGRVRLDWMSARDHRRANGETQSMLSAGLWQSIGEKVDVDGYVSMLEGRGRDLRLTGRWFDPELDLQLRGSYYRLLSRQTTNALDFDLFSSSLLDTEEYGQYSLSASKGFDEDLSIQGGLDLRRLDSSADEGQFNRDFDRYFVTTTFFGLGGDSTSLGVTVDLWNGSGSDYATLGADFTGRIAEDVEGSIGTYYSKYKTRVVGLVEQEDVRTYFLRLDWQLETAWSLDMAYEFEDSSVDQFHFLRADLRWSF